MGVPGIERAAEKALHGQSIRDNSELRPVCISDFSGERGPPASLPPDPEAEDAAKMAGLLAEGGRERGLESAGTIVSRVVWGIACALLPSHGPAG